MIGCLMTLFLTDIAKSTVGRLRPHFLDLCNPNVSCTSENAHVYIENYVCQATSHPLLSGDRFYHKLEDAR